MTVLHAGVLTLSDRASRGEAQDRSGPLIAEALSAAGVEVRLQWCLPDDLEGIAHTLRTWADSERLDLIVTTGGTGLSPRDHAPEATLSVAERQVPGLADAIRLHGLEKTPRAALSRAVAAQRGRCLIVNLPGSTGGVRDGLDVLVPLLSHIGDILAGGDGDHPRHQA